MLGVKKKQQKNNRQSSTRKSRHRDHILLTSSVCKDYIHICMYTLLYVCLRVVVKVGKI